MSEQILKNKWKSLAKRLSGLITISGEGSPQEIYGKLRLISKAQDNYFEPIFAKNPSGYIKVVYYIYSYLKTGNFDLADKIIPNLAYARVLSTEQETYYEHCDNCGGDGSVNCNTCDGNGMVDCDNCDGSGMEDCSNCGGTGMAECDYCDGTGEDEEGNTCGYCSGDGEVDCGVCKGDGEVTCSVCDGDSRVTCDDCSGNGYEECQECYGSGEQATDEIKYETFSICSYNKDVKNSCELNVNTTTPVANDDNLDDFWNNVITLRSEEEHAEALENIDSDYVYCFDYTTDPFLVLSKRDMSIEVRGDYESFYFDV